MSFRQPKSDKGRRSTVLPDVAVQALKRHKEHMMQERQAANPLVFFSTTGAAIYRSDLRRFSWLPLLNHVGLPAIWFHDMRHISATLLLAAGIRPKVAQERLGHSTISLTLDTYSHVLPTMQQDASDKMNDMLKMGVG